MYDLSCKLEARPGSVSGLLKRHFAQAACAVPKAGWGRGQACCWGAHCLFPNRSYGARPEHDGKQHLGPLRGARANHDDNLGLWVIEAGVSPPTEPY